MESSLFRALLAERVILADGGTGTTLLERGALPEACADLLNLSDRDLVRGVHEAFVAAGSVLIETNTFGANRFRLAAFGAAGRVAEINLAGAARAREAGAELVGGSIGPLGVRLAPYGRVSEAAAADAFAEQAAALVEGGVDLLVLETFSDLREALVALEAVRGVAPGIATIVSLTFTRDDRTLLGERPERVAELLAAAGADAVGANCSEGPDQVLRVLTAMSRQAPGLPLVAQPNAGGPQHASGRTLYSAAPEYTARYIPAFLEVGARIVGGCCGTRPSHIESAAAALRQRPTDAIRVEVLDEPGAVLSRRPDPGRSRLAEALASGERIITVEMEPPHGPSPSRMIAAAETLRDAGATTVNIADSPRAQLRMSPWAAAHLIQTEAGLETILHFPTRGRNLLRIQSDLLAASALGLRNLFAVMGDPTSGDTPGGADLAEVTPSGLIALIAHQLNNGVDGSGAEIGEPTRFIVGCAVNPNALDLDREVRVLRRKVEAGAGFALTQPVYEPGPLIELRSRYEDQFGALELPLLLGVLPLVNGRHAEFLHHEVPGITIPESVRERLVKAGEGREEGLSLAVEIAEACASITAGVYLIPAFRRYDAAAELVERLR